MQPCSHHQKSTCNLHTCLCTFRKRIPSCSVCVSKRDLCTALQRCACRCQASWGSNRIAKNSLYTPTHLTDIGSHHWVSLEHEQYELVQSVWVGEGSLLRPSDAPAQHGQCQASTCLLQIELEGRLAIHDGVQQTPQGPHVHLLVQLGVGGQVPQLGRAVWRAGELLRLLHERHGLLPIGHIHARSASAAEVRERRMGRAPSRRPRFLRAASLLLARPGRRGRGCGGGRARGKRLCGRDAVQLQEHVARLDVPVRAGGLVRVHRLHRRTHLVEYPEDLRNAKALPCGWSVG
mmetsp:Transcript_30758/g.57934  ORF Transcript_30758/g.57934 Transcript_30758/m.57934 type:complete len:291 (-) Transcript_30758:826-1698(-)